MGAGHTRPSAQCPAPSGTRPSAQCPAPSGSMSPQAFRHCLLYGSLADGKGRLQRASGLCGRICRGSKPLDFETFLGPEHGSHTRERAQVCWLLGSDGLETLVDAVKRSSEDGAMPAVMHMLLTIGYSPLDLYRAIVKKGYSYNLVVLRAALSGAHRATWDGLLAIVCESYPDAAAMFRTMWPPMVEACGPRGEGFPALEAAYMAEGFPALTTLEQADAARHIARARLLELYAKKELRPHHLRAWLFVAVNVRQNFRGDGYTWLANNERGGEEWLMRNRRLDAIGDGVLIPLGQPMTDHVLQYVCEQFKQEQQALEQRLGTPPLKQPSPQPAEPGLVEYTPSPAQYCEMLRLGRQVPPGQRLSGLCGRVCRGQRVTHFLGLAPLDGTRKVVFMLGSDGLEMVLRQRELPLQLLLCLGYNVLFLYQEIKRGTVFELVVCAASDAAGVTPATWDNIPKTVATSFGSHGARLSALVSEHLDQLKARSFYELQQAYTHPGTGGVMSMHEARANPDSSSGEGPPWYMTEQRLLALPAPRAADVRAFLYHAMNLNNLYSGDGYTYTPEGERGFREYLAPNKQKEQLGIEWASCPIGLPTIDECMEEISRTYQSIVSLQ